MSTATETIEELATQEYKYGFVTDIEADIVPPGLNEDIVRFISAQEERAGVAARLAAQGVPPLADDDGADAGRTSTTRRSTTRTSATTRRRSRSRSSTSLDEVDPEIARDVREARHPARGAEAARRRRGRRGVRQRLGRHDVQGQAGRSSASSSARSPRRCRSIPSWCRSTSARSCRTPTTSSRRSTPRSSRDGSFVLHPEGRALPDGAVDLLPHQRRRTPASSSAR